MCCDIWHSDISFYQRLTIGFLHLLVDPGWSIRKTSFRVFVVFLLFWQNFLWFTLSKFLISVIILDEPTITLDQSTLHQIPTHLARLLRQVEKSPTRNAMLNSLVVATGLETGFIGDWCCNDDTEDMLSAYTMNWNYSFDRNLVLDYARMPSIDYSEPHLILKFKLSLSLQHTVAVQSFIVDDLFMLVSHLVDNSVIGSTKSLAFPMSRYVVTQKMNSHKLPLNFRNLRELSINLKNQIFLPLRNQIFSMSFCITPYPSLHGLPAEVILLILKYLKANDVAALATTCQALNAAVTSFKCNKPPSRT